MTDEKTPNPVDTYVGARIRLRRREIGISQEKLAADLGLTFQQVQKYERGANRVSASKLYEVARSLSTPVGYFFEGLNDPTQSAPGSSVVTADNSMTAEFLTTNEGLELAGLFPKIGQRLRRRVLDLVRAIAAGDASVEQEVAS